MGDCEDKPGSECSVCVCVWLVLVGVANDKEWQPHFSQSAQGFCGHYSNLPPSSVEWKNNALNKVKLIKVSLSVQNSAI